MIRIFKANVHYMNNDQQLKKCYEDAYSLYSPVMLKPSLFYKTSMYQEFLLYLTQPHLEIVGMIDTYSNEVYFDENYSGIVITETGIKYDMDSLMSEYEEYDRIPKTVEINNTYELLQIRSHAYYATNVVFHVLIASYHVSECVGYFHESLRLSFPFISNVKTASLLSLWYVITPTFCEGYFCASDQERLLMYCDEEKIEEQVAKMDALGKYEFYLLDGTNDLVLIEAKKVKEIFVRSGVLGYTGAILPSQSLPLNYCGQFETIRLMYSYDNDIVSFDCLKSKRNGTNS